MTPVVSISKGQYLLTCSTKTWYALSCQGIRHNTWYHIISACPHWYISFLIIEYVCRKRAYTVSYDILLSGGNTVDRREAGGNVPGSISADLVQIRTTESNILHQLADLK